MTREEATERALFWADNADVLLSDGDDSPFISQYIEMASAYASLAPLLLASGQVIGAGS